MSIPALALRPAVDARPPVEPWFAGSVASQLDSPNQPPLRLFDGGEPEPLATAPIPARTPMTIAVVPSGVDPERETELIDQVRNWAPWFAQLLTEALDGRRPLEPLGRWLDDWVLAEVSRRVRLQRRERTRPRAAPPPPATVASLRVQATHPRVLEVSVRLRRGSRSTALAFQLVRRGERWRCTALQAS